MTIFFKASSTAIRAVTQKVAIVRFTTTKKAIVKAIIVRTKGWNEVRFGLVYGAIYSIKKSKKKPIRKMLILYHRFNDKKRIFVVSENPKIWSSKIIENE